VSHVVLISLLGEESASSSKYDIKLGMRLALEWMESEIKIWAQSLFNSQAGSQFKLLHSWLGAQEQVYYKS
jgi:hypothetical protein